MIKRIALLFTLLLFSTSALAVPISNTYPPSWGSPFWQAALTDGGVVFSALNLSPQYTIQIPSDTVFARVGAKVITDWESVLTRVPNTDEITYTGARRVANLLAANTSEDFSHASWLKAATATVTGTNIINLPAVGDRIQQLLTTSSGTEAVLSITLSGTGTVSIFFTGSGYDIGVSITLTATPTRYSISGTSASSSNGYFQIHRKAGDTATQVTANFAQREHVTGQSNQNPSEYVTTMTVDPISNVKGVTYSALTNGNTVDAGTGIVTEATGTALATYKGMSYEPDSTNKSTNHSIIGPDLVGTELMPNQVDRDFSGASAWANVDLSAYDETGDLTITATAANQYCTLPVLSAPRTLGKVYRLSVDVANLVSTWTIKSFDGTQTIGTLNAAGAAKTFDFVASTTGGYRIVSVANNSSADLDNFSLKEIGSAKADGTHVSGGGTLAKASRVGGTWSNPFVGMTASGGTDAESYVQIVSDTAKLATATPKLTRMIPSGKVFKAVAGATASFNIDITGNLTVATHTISIAARGASAADDDIALGDATTGVGAAIDLTNEYQIKSYTYTAAADKTRITIAAGDTVYFTLNQSEIGTVPTARVRTEGAATPRNRDAISWTTDDIDIAKGTLSGIFTAPFPSTSIPNSAVISLVSFSATATGPLYITRTAGVLQLKGSDGTNTVTLTMSEFAIGDSFTLKATWGTRFNIYSGNGALAGWGTSSAYTPFTLGASILPFYQNAYPWAVKEIQITNTFDKDGL